MQLVDQGSQENQLQVFRSWEAQETAMNRLKQNQRPNTRSLIITLTDRKTCR